MTNQKTIRYYYVDEAGDLTLFNKKGQIIVGKTGVSKVFMVGLVHLENPLLVHNKLEDLRKALLTDNRYQNIPSMQPEAQKTALYFHAKNDHSDIRQQVFNLLPSLGAKVQVAIRRKYELAIAAQLLKRQGDKLQPSSVYDDLVTRLFKNMLHQGDENKIIFARLGKSERREAIANAIRKAKDNFERRWSKGYDRPTTIDVKKSSSEIGLQVIDYYLWALQRLYERNDDSFFLPMAHNYSLIMDLDDKRRFPYGEWYSKSNPLTLPKIKPEGG